MNRTQHRKLSKIQDKLAHISQELGEIHAQIQDSAGRAIMADQEVKLQEEEEELGNAITDLDNIAEGIESIL